MIMVVLNIVKVVLLFVWVLLMIFGAKQMWNKKIKLGITSAFTIINIIQIPMQESYILSIVAAIGWFMLSLVLAVGIGENMKQ